VRGDTLSDVLRGVRLTGALFFVMEASAPWSARVPDGAALAPVLLPGAQHVISYHVVTRGSCWGQVADGPPVALQTGDVFVVPHGSAYAMDIEPARWRAPGAEDMAFFRQMAAGALPFTIQEHGGGREPLHLVCGSSAVTCAPSTRCLRACRRFSACAARIGMTRCSP
jgi:hypothetical protein